jgi:2-polyprenyl-3-methyl-5-hydroxy-6-metoxy-1,4-benzoquinol methylase
MSGLNCPACGLSGTSFKKPFGDYDLYKCQQCGVCFFDPMKAGHAEYYEKLYGALGEGYGDIKWEYGKFFSDARRLKFGTGKLLEIGCGPGYFLKSARDYGFGVYGIDFNEAAIRHAQKLGLGNVAVGSVLDIGKKFPAITFDVVVLSSVLEHLENPKEIIQSVGSILTPQGILAIVVPNARRSILRLNLRRRREGWDYPPHHLTWWDRDSMSRFLALNDLQTIVVDEEPVRTLRQNFRFVKGLFQLLTSTALLAKAKTRASDSPVGSSRTRSFGMVTSVLASLAALKDFFLSVFAFLFLPLSYLISRLVRIRGTNLYVLARKQ